MNFIHKPFYEVLPPRILTVTCNCNPSWSFPEKVDSFRRTSIQNSSFIIQNSYRSHFVRSVRSV